MSLGLEPRPCLQSTVTLQFDHVPWLELAEQLQSALSSLQLEVQQLQTSRDKCVRLAAASQRLGATAVVHLAAAVPALQQRQVMLSEALTTTVAGWKRQGAAAMAALARCKAEVVELRQRAAKQQEAAEVEVRRAVEAAAEAAQLVAATHEDQVENLTRRFQEVRRWLGGTAMPREHSGSVPAC